MTHPSGISTRFPHLPSFCSQVIVAKTYENRLMKPCPMLHCYTIAPGGCQKIIFPFSLVQVNEKHSFRIHSALPHFSWNTFRIPALFAIFPLLTAVVSTTCCPQLQTSELLNPFENTKTPALSVHHVKEN